MCNTHKGPVNISFLLGIASSCNCKMAYDVVGTDKINADISTSCVLNVHSDSDVFHASQIRVFKLILGHIKRNAQTISALRNRLLDVDPGRKEPRLRLDQLPILGLLDQSPRVNLAIPKGVTELFANRCVLLVVLVALDGKCGIHSEVLEISPSKIRTNLKNKGKDTSCKGRSSRCTTMGLVTAVLSNIGGVLRRLVKDFMFRKEDLQ